MNLTPELLQAIETHGLEQLPREACGLLAIERGVLAYHPCANLAVGTDQFVLAPEDYAAIEARADIVAIVHTHPHLPASPSQADRVACEASGLPWVILSIPNADVQTLAPEGYEAPLIGREWSHGVLDCYAIIRDWYRLERGISLPDFPRSDEWWKRGGNLYVENFEAAGFVRVDESELAEGDVILMQMGSPVPNHGAVYLGDERMLHHLQNRLSCRDIYGGIWKKHTTHVLRYAP